jgi:fumarate reductase subunit D
MDIALYEDKPKYDVWFRLLLGFAPTLTLILGVLFYFGVLSAETESKSRASGLALFGITVFVLLLYWAVLPRKFLVLEDRVKITFGVFSFNIPFHTIKEVKIIKGSKFFGFNSVTSFRSMIEIVRKRWTSVSISPDNRDLFLAQLNKAMADWKRNQGIT